MSRRLLICVLALALTGCTATPEPPPPVRRDGEMRLVAFDSCEQLFADVRRAAKAAVGPYGLPGNQIMEQAVAVTDGGGRTMADSAAAGAPAAASDFSTTNVHEQGADEPDLIKTDGRRIVTVLGGDLRVIDAATRRETGRIDLGVGWAGDLQLLLSGDSAVVLARGDHHRGRALIDAPPVDSFETSPQVLLVDLTGAPKVVSRYRGEGSLVDARMTGSTARVVLRSQARIAFPRSEKPDIRTNRKVIDNAPDSAWLPRWEVTDAAGNTTKGQTDCGRVSRPTDYSGGTMVSVLTFDLTRPELGSGDPVTVMADGDTVYATPDSLYLANSNRWRWDLRPGGPADRVRPQTEFFKFALAGNQPPTYRSSGSVAGYLLNQYAMSEWEGHLRVATTDETTNDSAVRVLADRDGKLVQTGIADGLGKDERIYSVRFIGARGYVVTFRQTDPLYSLDLRDPAKPAVTGELKITGYSAHLQPVGEDRLIGIGQEADTDGRTQGLQVSLFDVADPANPKRLAQHHVPGAYSQAEYDPHGLLWWPATKLLVVPVESQGALALTVTDDLKLTEQFGQPGTLRSLVIGNELWAMSKTGLTAFDLSTMDQRATLPLN